MTKGDELEEAAQPYTVRTPGAFGTVGRAFLTGTSLNQKGLSTNGNIS